MSDELRVTSDESPRPWHIDNTRQGPYIMDVNGGIVAWVLADDPEMNDPDAALIVRAVNGRADLLKAREMLQAECRGLAVEADRLADIVRRAVDFMERKHAVSEADRALLAEARKAIGEDGAE